MGGGTSKVSQSVAGRFEGPGNLRGNPIWFPGRIQGGVIGRVFQWIAGHTWLVPQTGAELSGRQSLHKSRTGAVASIRRWGWVFACEHGGPERTGPTLAPVVLRILSFEATSAKDTLKTPCGGLLSPLTGRMGMLPSPPQPPHRRAARPGCSVGLLPGERIGKTVQLRCGPAAVTGDCVRETHCQESKVNQSPSILREGAERRQIRKPEDLPRCRFPVRVFRGKDAAAADRDGASRHPAGMVSRTTSPLADARFAPDSQVRGISDCSPGEELPDASFISPAAGSLRPDRPVFVRQSFGEFPGWFHSGTLSC